MKGFTMTEEQYEAHQQKVKDPKGRLAGAVALVPAAPLPPAIRQSRKQPNKTERRFEIERLHIWQRTGEIVGYQFEPITLRLANGVKYTPDYLTNCPNNIVRIYEVKGGYIREDAKIKLKVAASQFYFVEFYLAQYKKGAWTIGRVWP